MIQIDSLRERLETVNLELAEMLQMNPTPLVFQGGEADADALFLYGIVGGKDVGKTSLINQLAGERISIDTDILDEGTRVAVAYCHQEDLSALRKRLDAPKTDRVKFVVHQRQELRNVVLVDFPDFDSRFTEHRDDVRRFSRHLQGIVWVTSPRKYGDHEFLEQLETVAQSHEYYFIVVNKVDQIAGLAGLDEIRNEVFPYLERECLTRRIPSPDPSRFFLISALNPKDYEFSRLQARLVRIHSPHEISKAKIENLNAEFQKNIKKIREFYGMERRLCEIEQAVEFSQKQVYETFTEDYFQAVERRVMALEALRRRISSQIFSKRVERLPLLWILFYPLSGLIAALGGWLAYASSPGEASESTKELLRFQGLGASLWLQKIGDQLTSRFPALIRQCEPFHPEAAEIEDYFHSCLRAYEDQVTERILSSIRPLRKFHKILIYLPILWFPILQPVLVQILREEQNGLSLTGLAGAVVVFLTILGAGSLLVSLLFLLVFYSVWLVILYAQGVRQVQKAGEEEFRLLWYERMIQWIRERIIHPLTMVHDNITERSLQLDSIEQEMKDILQHIMSK